MARKKNNDDHDEGLPAWMGTYGDLVTLLLTFFILLFSMANLDAKKFEEIAQAMKTTFMRLDSSGGGESFNDNKGKEFISLNENNRQIIKKDENKDKKEKESESESEKKEELEKLESEIEDLTKKYGLVNDIEVTETKSSYIIRLDSIMLFNSASANIKKSALKPLKELSTYLKSFKKEISIQGHTDNLPIITSEFPTNWELSTRRATNVTLFLIKECDLDPYKLTASGNGEYKPIVPNNSEANRNKNRRIDISIQK
ncbi:MAG: flagellar motor protein MotB [Clostridiales bacterium]